MAASDHSEGDFVVLVFLFAKNSTQDGVSSGREQSGSDHSEVTMEDNGAARSLMVCLHLTQPLFQRRKENCGKWKHYIKIKSKK